VSGGRGRSLIRVLVQHLIGGALAAVMVSVVGSGCERYRIERHTRPSFYHSASSEPLPDRLEMPDGTIIEYRDAVPQKPTSTNEDGELLQIREELEDGSVVLRCIVPEHVIANAMTCIRNSEYELMWNQLLSKRTRLAYASREEGLAEFAEFMDLERAPIMETLNRMSFGFLGQDVILESAGQGMMQVRFSPRLASQFKYKYVEMVMEDGLMRLLVIR